MKLRYQRVSYTSTEGAGRQLERLLDYMLDASRNTALNMRGEWRPPVDVYGTDAHVEVLVELAGMDEEDIEVVLFEDVLVVKGERKPRPSADQDLTYYEAGVRYGRFHAEVFLPSAVEADRAEATYTNGFLQIRLPKRSTRQLRPTVAGNRIDE